MIHLNENVIASQVTTKLFDDVLNISHKTDKDLKQEIYLSIIFLFNNL